MEITDVRQKMEKVLEIFRTEIGLIKTGRATPALIEKVVVEAYETKMPLVELATITTPSANELLVAPFDQSIIRNIEKALGIDRGLGLMPILEENVIRLKIPPLTEERRKEFVKLLGQKLEGARIMIRQVRGEKMRGIRDAQQRKEITEDEHFQVEKELQKLTDEFNQKIEEIGKQKEQELLSVSQLG